MILTILNSERRRILLLVLWLLLILCVVVGSLDPLVQMPGIYAADKIIHASAYFILAFLPTLAYQQGRSRILAMLTVIVIGGVIEIAQRTVPGREASVLDFVANCLGVAAGMSAGLIVAHLLEKWRTYQAAQRASIASQR